MKSNIFFLVPIQILIKLDLKNKMETEKEEDVDDDARDVGEMMMDIAND